jgi:DnaJ-class molecular chaperone
MIKKFNDLNYYELLKIQYNASSFEVRQAYKNILAIYEESSLATYALFTEDERKTILGKIEKAFSTLIDDEKRNAYDKSLVDVGGIPKNLLAAKERQKAIPLFQVNTAMTKDSNLARIRKKIKEKGTGKLASVMLNRDFISGQDLKNLRESLGIELEEVFEATKISPTALEAIERDDTTNLPPKVYLKSFLKSYAEVLQLDAKQLVDGYVKNMEKS